ncbi:hypothetical protein BDW60DRAFT_219922 [Aspergillus nidulans var. acristatus]
MSWISGPEDTPWQPVGSRWGLGYVDLGPQHQSFWQDANVTFTDNRMSVAYALDRLDVDVTRTLDEGDGILEECYVFTDTGTRVLPFNDHYTSTTDVLKHLAHAHVWANSGASSWIKLTRMGLRGPHLGIVFTQGALQRYNIEGKSRVTLSNSGMDRSCRRNRQSDRFRAKSGRGSGLEWPGAELKLVPSGNGSYSTSIQTDRLGEQEVSFTVGEGEKRVKSGCDAVYDKQMEGIATFDTSDRNTGRERVGMGVLIARWLQQNPDYSPDIEESLRIYYDYISNKLQEADGQRFLDTIERLYDEPEAIDYYPINLPIHESLVYFTETGNEDTVARLLTLFTAHGDRIASVGSAYPSAEVNYEQSIIAPAAIILLEQMSPFGTGTDTGKDRMWGDIFPHYWSTLTAIAMHHYAVATEDEHYSSRAEGIFRANLVLSTRKGGDIVLSSIRQVSMVGRGANLDPYANDQDWASAHHLALREDGTGEVILDEPGPCLSGRVSRFIKPGW